MNRQVSRKHCLLEFSTYFYTIHWGSQREHCMLEISTNYYTIHWGPYGKNSTFYYKIDCERNKLVTNMLIESTDS